MERQAIRNEGEGAEAEFLRLVTGARKSDSAKHGDAIVKVDGRDGYVEVKFVTSNTINQVRAIKFIPVAIYSPQLTLPWAVLPAAEVVRLVFEKNRGQHTELALESANLSVSGLPTRFRFAGDGLSQAVHEAVRSARRYPELAATLTTLMKRLTDTKEEFQDKVRAALIAGDRR